MKHVYLFLAVILISVYAHAQQMHVHKTDNSTTSFNLIEIDSITFTVPATSAKPVLFTKHPTSGSGSNLYTMNIDGTGMTLLYTVSGELGFARYNSQKTKIVYRCNNSTTGKHEIFIMNVNGTGATQITFDNPQYGNSSPIFRSSSKIWYANAQSTGWTEFQEINYDGTGKTKLTNFYSSGKSGDHIEINGTSTKVYYYKQNSSWSPSGEIYSANIDFTGEVRLTNNTDLWDGFPRVSPNGNKLVFLRNISNLSSVNNVFIMNVDGSSVTQLTFHTGSQSANYAVWTTDGNKILYSKYDGSQWDIYIMNADGSSNVNLTNTSNYNEYVWDCK